MWQCLWELAGTTTKVRICVSAGVHRPTVLRNETSSCSDPPSASAMAKPPNRHGRLLLKCQKFAFSSGAATWTLRVEQKVVSELASGVGLVSSSSPPGAHCRSKIVYLLAGLPVCRVRLAAAAGEFERASATLAAHMQPPTDGDSKPSWRQHFHLSLSLSHLSHPAKAESAMRLQPPLAVRDFPPSVRHSVLGKRRGCGLVFSSPRGASAD